MRPKPGDPGLYRVEPNPEPTEYERKLDEIVSAAKRQGIELTHADVHQALFEELEQSSVEEATRRAADARRIVKQQGAQRVPARRPVEEWTREDFLREVEQDRDRDGRGGRRSVGRHHNVSGDVLYRRWRKVSPGEPWPSGEKAPSHRRE